MKLREALRADVERALELLEDQYAAVEPLDAACAIVTGAGDSFAAALLAPALHPGARAADPMAVAYGDVVSELARRGCALIAVSLGGRTRTVVEAARRFRRAGGAVVAVTGDPASPLAAHADRVVTVLHAGLARGVGAGRHLLTLVALAALLGAPAPVRPPWPRGCPDRLYGYVFAGCCETESAALYAALKVYEVYGLPAQWWGLEQFVHAPVLGAPGDKLVVFECLGARERVDEVVSTLREVGVDVLRVEARGPTRLDNALWSSLWTLACMASARDVPDEPRYASHPGLDRLTRLIYYEADAAPVGDEAL